MEQLIEKTGFLGRKRVIYIEKQREGEHALIDGEWIWIRKEV